MPEVNVDEKNFELYKQCEIRRPSPDGVIKLGEEVISKPAGYYFDIVWIEADLARKNNLLQDKRGNRWTVHEVHGSKMMASGRESFKQVVP